MKCCHQPNFVPHFNNHMVLTHWPSFFLSDSTVKVFLWRSNLFWKETALRCLSLSQSSRQTVVINYVKATLKNPTERVIFIGRQKRSFLNKICPFYKGHQSINRIIKHTAAQFMRDIICKEKGFWIAWLKGAVKRSSVRIKDAFIHLLDFSSQGWTVWLNEGEDVCLIGTEGIFV